MSGAPELRFPGFGCEFGVKLRKDDMNKIGNSFASLATMLLIVSSAAPFSHHERDTDKGKQVGRSEKALLWQTRGSNGNGCAVGNSPPPGTNC